MGKHGLSDYLKAMVEQQASDLHISTGVPPEFRIEGKMVKVKEPPLTATETKEICYSVLSEAQKAEFERYLELDFSFSIKDISRFRANLFIQKGSVAGVFRRIPFTVPQFESLGLPPVLKRVIKRPTGLVLVTGPTGSGKTTTIASLLDIINREEKGHILTIEDPIEYVHAHKNCIVNQREVGADTLGFSEAVRRVLRQDPDYILLGELRDMETIAMALTMAETGHLVFATLHTNSAVQSINRIINVFPPHQQSQIRGELSFVLQAVITQQLIPSMKGSGRVLAIELLIPTLGIRNLIREDKLHQVYAMMQSGQSDSDMCTMNQSLSYLVKHGHIDRGNAFSYTTLPEELEKILDGSKKK